MPLKPQEALLAARTNLYFIPRTATYGPQTAIIIPPLPLITIPTPLITLHSTLSRGVRKGRTPE